MDPSPRPSPHVVLVASPCAGHVMPMADLARRLVAFHGCAATLVTFSGLAASLDAHSAAVLASLPASSVAAVTLPEVTLDDVPADANFGTLIFELVRRSLPNLRQFLRSIGGGVTALVPDFFCGVVLDLAVELGVPGYVFVPSNTASLAFMRRFVEVHDGAAPGEYRDLPDPLRLAGDVTIRVADMPDGYLDRSNPVFWQLLEEVRRYRRADGFLVNSFAEMESTIVEEFKTAAEQGAFPPVYPVGPFVRPCSDEAGELACLEWLDRQPAGSVVFVSFGSAGMLSVEQTRELAAGLEMSGHGFLWVVRMPSHDGESYDFATDHRNDDEEDRDGGGHDDDPLAWLPDGFLERTSGRGLAVASWAPQVRVLSHPATAAFVSHCGWNSALESVSAGVPMVAWPLYAEQKVNAVILTEVAGVALRPAAARGGVDGVVTREEVAAAVEELMDPGEKGSAARRRAREMQAAAARARSPGGASHRELDEVAGKWKQTNRAPYE
ncbi:UDP-glycosyltransferase 72B1-like [Oryza glaberrima]|nr:UDP-glycosyltransferase 72B1-like [Oryza glaberrima]